MKEKYKDIFDFIENKFSHLAIEPGVLYVVATPIGNLDDISFRAIYVLKNVDLIAAEDTRRTGQLLSFYGIKNKIVSYYSQVESKKIDYIMYELKNGKPVALVSDAGTPCISDPGSILVNACIENGIKVVPVPGANSVIQALVMSGFETDTFYFQGFLPVKKGRETRLEELRNIKDVIVIFESKFRIKKTMSELKKFFGTRDYVLFRELTKKFEESIIGNFSNLDLDKIKEVGEFVIVINNSK
ncbi:MAG: 16S rRNA (cytidine(1402)-2'-O)-methyltransferase [Ignavibacteria bacterium]